MSRNVGRVRQLQIVTPEEELENLKNEVGALKRTVESKSAAVNILRAELQECQKERDKFRTLVEDETLHRSSVSCSTKKAAYSDPCRSAMLSGSEGTLAQLLSLSKEENKTLRLESTELRCKLHDAQADIKVLREEIQMLKGGEGRRRSLAHTATSQLAHQEREQFISQMEALSSKCQALEGDVRGLIEEREELVRELDASSHKLHRLNYMLNTILASTSMASALNHPKRLIDLDAIITENRYLQERLKQTEEEKNLARSNALKYKAALEKSRTQGSIKLGSSENLIVTPKQVSELLRDYRGEVDGAAETDLKSLCVALVDALNQRSRVLRTQRSANKVLVNRVTELERRLSSSRYPVETNADNMGAETTTHITSLGLMEGYVPPSGPIPKFSEEDVLNDPRLVQLLNSGTKGDNTKLGKEISEDPCVHDKEVSISCLSRSESEDGAYDKCTLKASNDSLTSTDSKTTTGSSFVVAENTSAIHREQCEIQKTGTPESKNNKEIHHECHNNEASQSVLKKYAENVRDSPNNEKLSCYQVNEVCDRAPSQMSKLESQTVSVSGDIKNQTSKHRRISTYVNPEDELEEIVPIDQLDLYIKEIQERRKASKTTASAKCEVNVTKQDASDPSKIFSEADNVQDLHDIEKESLSPTSEKEDKDDSSFDLDISDYDSDNDNLDLALQDWQNDVNKNYNGKKEKKRKSGRSKEGNRKEASGREKFGFWQKDSTAETKINPALKEFLDKATAAAVDNNVDMP